MLLSRRNPPVNIPPIFIRNSTIEWISKSQLLGMTIDEKLIWTQHMLELKKSFAKKLGLLKKSRFLPRNVRQDLYFKVILPSVTYGLILWGSCCNSDLFQSMEILHCRAARLTFNLPKDMASADVLQRAQWPTLSIHYQSAIFICLHKAFHDRLPVTLIDLARVARSMVNLTSVKYHGNLYILIPLNQRLALTRLRETSPWFLRNRPQTIQPGLALL